ncbi:Branched-chain amino acid ABC-type transport system, permease component [Hoeflea phototrophica DFL-43]|jgi:branched-chain amino acid transport system permease protein|uniref:Branched-chain amino acid ABC-type transport system, permease component n=1 Tax=Hoeflea phototrophica (strain DSM 17068 / NCIMB 14078 / DFL-43) TaxID=411684 RepID=A9CZL9_HOEPD|nr:branched-chain amino acid ABC transporter permease [Hoeflea phototrophica]EDQ34793.1 Branched-chain amino acid ABC-type transport system, permease component [Hoeflea phototrophica DFL-43]
MDLAATILVDGLIYAGWLFIVSVGLTLVFGVLNILNIAHGSLYAIGAYAAASMVGAYFALGGEAFPYGSYVAMILAAVLVALVLGPLLERGLLRFFYGRDEVLNVLVTYAVFLILEDVMKLIWGVNPYFVYEPYTLLGDVEIGPLFYVGYDFAVIAAAIIVGLAVWLTLNRTRVGKVVLAVIHDSEMSQTMGVNVQRIYLGAFMAGTFLAALGGALTAPMISVTPGLGVNVIIVAFAVVIIGGLGSVPGAAIGALMVGISRAASVHLLPEAELFIIYFVMAIVLLFRPEGLFAKTQARKI